MMISEDKTASITAAIRAWEAGNANDQQLDIAIEATELTLVTLRAYGANWVATMGLQTTLTSMTMAHASRHERKRRSVAPTEAK